MMQGKVAAVVAALVGAVLVCHAHAHTQEPADSGVPPKVILFQLGESSWICFPCL